MRRPMKAKRARRRPGWISIASSAAWTSCESSSGWLDAACRGDGRLVTVVGEAGVGKSTLVRQLEPEIRVRAGLLVVGQNTHSAVKTPFAPWVDVLTAIQRQGIVPTRDGTRLVASFRR